MDHKNCLIKTGSKVAIVGGGPAGSFFALYLRHFTELKGIKPEITIYQQRSFDALGPEGCKGCAGIISLSLMKNLAELNLALPPEIIQTAIDRFALHSPYGHIDISNPEKDSSVMSVYRGGGPRISHFEKRISFDGWLLRQAENRGVMVVNETVSRIRTAPRREIEISGKRISFDLVVLAAGVNAKSTPVEGAGYAPPEAGIMAMNELYAGAAAVQSCLGNAGHAFLIPHSGLIFGTLVPKGEFINVSVLSSGKYPMSISDFLNYDFVKEQLPPHYEFACGCRPRAATTSSVNYYADGFVALGDAAITRLYKDGIGSSLTAALIAAQTVVDHGTSSRDFKHYYRPFCRTMQWNNKWGHLLFTINDKVKDSRLFLQTQQRLIGDEQDNHANRQPFTMAAWGMFTGIYTYGNIAKKVFNPLSLMRLISALIKEGLCLLPGKKEENRPRKLYVGGRNVLILGSGFGGIYTLRHLVRRTNKNEKVNITLVSNENYFLFTPLLHEVAMGSIETRHIAYPVRRLHWRDRFNFVRAEVEKIDLDNRRVTTTAGTLNFDCLVLSLGSVTDKSQLNLESGNIFTLKTLYDAIRIRNHIIGVFEQASIEKNPERQNQLLTFVVVGGGYIGVQAVSELRDFILGSLPRYYKNINTAQIRIVLIEAGTKIIGRLDSKLGAYVMEQLKGMGIEVRTMSRMTRAWEGHAEINGQEIIPASTILWTTGMRSNPRIAELNVEKDNLGRLSVNAYLEVPGAPGVYALGDCAHFEDAKSGKPIPPRAHTTVRQAKIAAQNILADIRGRNKKAYRYTDTGEIVSVGDTKAVLRFYRLRLYGFPARLIWLIGYSSLVTGTYNRVRIVMDWLLSLIFGRDATFLNLKEQSIMLKKYESEKNGRDIIML